MAENNIFRYRYLLWMTENFYTFFYIVYGQHRFGKLCSCNIKYRICLLIHNLVPRILSYPLRIGWLMHCNWFFFLPLNLIPHPPYLRNTSVLTCLCCKLLIASKFRIYNVVSFVIVWIFHNWPDCRKKAYNIGPHGQNLQIPPLLLP